MTALPVNRVNAAIRDGEVFRRSQQLKSFGVPHLGYSFRYEEPKDRLSSGTLYILFKVPIWAAKKATNGLEGLPSVSFSIWGNKDNTVQLAFRSYN